MKKLYFIILGLVFSFTYAQENLKLVTVKLAQKKQLRFLQQQHFDIAGIEILKSGGALVDIVVNPQELWKLEGFGADFVYSPKMGTPKSRRIDSRFKNPKEIENILRQVSQAFPHITRLVQIGESLEKRPIWAIQITKNPHQHQAGKPSVLFNSMHHAREVMSPEVSLDIIEYLTTQYSKSKQVRFWVDNVDIWVVPMLNVDGNAKVWEGQPYWRKNTRDGHGVDLNRNYPADWGKCNGSSGNKYSDTYRGPSPASEPETKTLMNLVSKIRPVFDISYHSYSQLVLYPMGCSGDYALDRPLVEGIGKHLGKLLNYKAGYCWDILYSADGGDIDWMYKRWGVISYVLELNSRRDGFHPAYSKRQLTVERNRPAWQYLLNRLFQSGVDIRTSLRNERVVVKVFNTLTTKLVGRYELKTDGSLRIMLTPGNYEIHFIKEQEIAKKTIKIDTKLIPLRLNL